MPSKPFTAARDGFSLNAGVLCEHHERAKLERLYRYVCCPPIAKQRLSIDDDGLVVYALNGTFSDGTMHVLFKPHYFIARLATLRSGSAVTGEGQVFTLHAFGQWCAAPPASTPFSFYNSYSKLDKTKAYKPKLGFFVEELEGRKYRDIRKLRASRAPDF